MTVEQPWTDGEVAGDRTHMGSYLSLTALSPGQRKCLLELAERFAQDTRVQPTPPGPPYDYYIRGRKDLQLVHDAIAWYSIELNNQYEETTIKMIEGIMWEAITRLDEMGQELNICIDTLGEQDG